MAKSSVNTRSWIENFGYMAWANERVERGIATVMEQDEPMRLYGHILGAENLWLTRILGLNRPFDVWPSLNLESARVLRTQNLTEFARVATDEVSMHRNVAYETTTGETHTSLLGDILVHLLTHGHYHRGQVARAIKAGGGQPLDTDYITWSRNM